MLWGYKNTKVAHTDRRYKRRCEVVIWEPKQYTCLSYAGVTDEEQFEQQVVGFLSHFIIFYAYEK